MKKKIEIEIPDGKCAKWVNSVLTLVNDTPKDIREGWEPTFEKDEERWCPWFKIKQGGLVFAYAYGAGSLSGASGGVRLVFKSKELAEYAGKQFTDIYNDFCYGRNKL